MKTHNEKRVRKYIALFVSFEIKGLLFTNAESVIFIMYVNMVELCQTKILLDALTLGYNEGCMRITT